MFRFAQIVGSTPPLRSALVDRDLAIEARQGLVTQLLEGKVQPGTLALVRYAIAGGRARDIVGTLNWLVEQTAAARGWRIARVRAARRLTTPSSPSSRRRWPIWRDRRWSCRWSSSRRSSAER